MTKSQHGEFILIWRILNIRNNYLQKFQSSVEYLLLGMYIKKQNSKLCYKYPGNCDFYEKNSNTWT